MAAQANTTKHPGRLLGLSVFAGLGLLAAQGCQVTTGPSSPSSSTPGGSPDAGADAPSMTAADPQSGGGDGGACPAIRPKSCPAQGAACTQAGANCSYGDYCCTCGDGMMQWFCAQTDAPDPCPKDPPPVGYLCSLDIVGCRYCTPQGLLTAVCTQGHAVSYYAPQCEETIPPPPPPMADAGSSSGPPPDAGMSSVPQDM